MCDISLHDRLSGMSEDQAEAICKILQSAISENQQKKHTWKEIESIFNEELVIESISMKTKLTVLTLLVLLVSVSYNWIE
jgi:hypothetical protein